MVNINDIFQNVFEKVFGFKAVQMEYGKDCLQNRGEKQVVSISFSGDCEGTLFMILKEENICRAAMILAEYYQITVPMAPEAVFAEVMNIFAGNLVMELAKKCVKINIGIPKSRNPKAHEKVTVLAWKLSSDQNIVFKFCMIS